MKAALAKHSFLSFVVIAFAWTWPCAALINYSLLFPMLGLFGPCIAAVVVIWGTRGRPGLADLVSKFRFSRALLGWLTLAALFPLAMLVPIWVLHGLFWGPVELKLGPLAIVSFVLSVLIVGEEAGWRGFLLPYLLQRFAPLPSALIVGLVWALWHLPNFLLPAFPHHGLPFEAFVLMAVAFSVLFTWLYLKTAGNLLIATTFHAALNLFSLVGVEPLRQYWLKAVVYVLAAFALGGALVKSRKDKGSVHR